MKQFKGDKILDNLSLGVINFYINYLITILRECRSGQYNIISANCKTLARSILYFCEKDCNMSTVIQSNLGIFTDKPLYAMALLSLDGIAIEKTFYHSFKLFSEDFKALLEQLENRITKLRSQSRIASMDETLLAIEESW